MGRYRKKPIVITAFEIKADSAQQIVDWMNGCNSEHMDGEAELYGNAIGTEILGIRIPTLEGVFDAPIGWWVIRGVIGEFYACEAGVFAQSYEDAE